MLGSAGAEAAEQQTTRALALEGKALLVRVLSAGDDGGGSVGTQHAAMASIPTSAELFSGDIILLGDQTPSTTVQELKVLVAENKKLEGKLEYQKG